MVAVKRLLITGTREGWDPEHLTQVLDEWYAELSQYGQEVMLVHGAAEGVDLQAAHYWKKMKRPVEPHPAKWNVYGMKAGPIRNAEMVELNADICIAFPGKKSVGTHDCVRKARHRGIKTVVYRSPTEKAPKILDGQLSLFDPEKETP